jgi:hypothetical protein
MKWAIYLKTDAVLTNDPEKYLALRDSAYSERDLPPNWPLKDQLILFFWNWLGFLIMSFRVWRFSRRERKANLGKIEKTVVEGVISEKLKEIHD